MGAFELWLGQFERTHSGKGRRGTDKAAAQAKTPPNFGGVSAFERLRSTCRLGRLLLRHLRLQDRDRGADLDRAGLRCFRHFANHVDMEQAIVEAGAHHLHVVGEAKAPLERASGDATVQ